VFVRFENKYNILPGFFEKGVGLFPAEGLVYEEGTIDPAYVVVSLGDVRQDGCERGSWIVGEKCWDDPSS
jgi:hypothetical protein